MPLYHIQVFNLNWDLKAILQLLFSWSMSTLGHHRLSGAIGHHIWCLQQDRSIQVDNFCLISLRKTVACLLILTIWINQGRKNESNNTEIKITWNLNILKHSTLIFCWLSSNIYLYEDEHVHYTTYMHRIISDTGLYKG